jgi:hypothetical protein
MLEPVDSFGKDISSMEGHLQEDPSLYQWFQVQAVNYRKTSRLEAKRSKLTDQP